MTLFNNKVTITQILDFFNWELTISDLIQLESKTFPISIENCKRNKIASFEEEFNSYLPFKRNELLYTNINEQKSNLLKFNMPQSPLSEEDYLFIDDYNYYNLCHGFYKLYTQGKNYQLKHLEALILPVLESGLDYSIGMYNLGGTTDQEYKVEDISIESLCIFNSYIYSALKLVVITIEFLKHLEEKCKVTNPDQSEPNRALGKINFKGTPAQFAYLIELLISRGYIDQISTKAYTKARILLDLFKFENYDPSYDSLGKIFSRDEDPIKNPDHKKRFEKIPYRDELDK